MEPADLGSAVNSGFGSLDAGLVDVRLLAVEGPSWIVEDPADFANQLFAARAVESEPVLMGATSHIMMIGYRDALD